MVNETFYLDGLTPELFHYKGFQRRDQKTLQLKGCEFTHVLLFLAMLKHSRIQEKLASLQHVQWVNVWKMLNILDCFNKWSVTNSWHFAAILEIVVNDLGRLLIARLEVSKPIVENQLWNNIKGKIMKKRPWIELKIAISYISSILSYGGFELEVKFTINIQYEENQGISLLVWF